jgi:hypothetical protein
MYPAAMDELSIFLLRPSLPITRPSGKLGLSAAIGYSIWFVAFPLQISTNPIPLLLSSLKNSE